MEMKKENIMENENLQEKKVENQNENKKEKSINIFTQKNLPIWLVVASLCVVFLNRFITLLAQNTVVYAIFFMISFGLALSAFLVDIIAKLNKHEVKFDITLLLSMFAIIVALA